MVSGVVMIWPGVSRKWRLLCVLAQALTAALRARLPGHAAVTPDVLRLA